MDTNIHASVLTHDKIGSRYTGADSGRSKGRVQIVGNVEQEIQKL